MRLSSLAALAFLPLLVACASETDPIAGQGPGPAGDPRDDDFTASGSEGASPGSATGSTPGAAGDAAPGTPTTAACPALPACDGAGGPQLAPARSFNHYLSTITAASGPAFHRGRDMIVSAGDPQWVIGKMTYTYIDKDLVDEDVDVFVERGCAGGWEQLGSVRTTDNSGAHATVEGVEDNGGRVYFQIPKAKELGVGRHRVRLVVAADQTSTDLVIEVVAKGTPIVVSDVDGTLTDSENAEYASLLSGSLSGSQPRAAEMLGTLAAKGYHVVYVTSRPEWLTGRTHEFLKAGGFPAGVVHTTAGTTGAMGTFATVFKAGELAMLEGHGHSVQWVFGNATSDGDACEAAGIEPVGHRVLLRADDAHGARRIEAYSEIIAELAALPSMCR